jgi:hypothetical protein
VLHMRCVSPDQPHAPLLKGGVQRTLCFDGALPASCSQMARMADRGEIDFLVHTGE